MVGPSVVVICPADHASPSCTNNSSASASQHGADTTDDTVVKKENVKINSIGITDFARGRHTPEGYSHFTGSWEDLVFATLQAAQDPDNVKPGDAPGSCLVQVPSPGFYSSVIDLRENPDAKLWSVYEARRGEEEKFVQTFAEPGPGAIKLPAGIVNIVLFPHDLLGEDATGEFDFEIVSVNADPRYNGRLNIALPPTPITIERNAREKEGGTKAEYSVEKVLDSIEIWQHLVHIREQPKPE
jgi:hypothetical protein